MASSASLNVGALKVFLKVSAGGSMTAAARAMGITQSAVSQIIRQLEDGLGVVLFDRARRPLGLTAAGSVLARRAERLTEEAEQLPAILREASGVLEIRVGMIDSFAGTVGPHLIRAFMDSVSTIKLWAGLNAPLTQALLDRELDVVVTSEPMEDVDGLRRYPLLREPFLLALPKSFPVRRQGVLLEALARERPLIRYSARSATGLQVDRHLRRLSIAAPRRLEIDSSDTLFAMVAAGVGWAITTPLCILHGRIDRATIRLERLPGPGFTRHLTLIARPGEYESLVERLADAGRHMLKEQCLPEMRRYIPWLRDEVEVQ